MDTVVSDKTIEKSAAMEINSHNDLRDANNIHFNIIAYNGLVLITGEATNTKLRNKLISIVRVIPNVKLVHNEMTIAPTESFSSQSNDTYLTTQVKSALQEIDNLPEFDAAMIKVVTENSVVYLIGLVHQAEGKAVATKTQHVAGVVKIVTLFEYID
jgi:osmotically-inducible protein OsmY